MPWSVSAVGIVVWAGPGGQPISCGERYFVLLLSYLNRTSHFPSIFRVSVQRFRTVPAASGNRNNLGVEKTAFGQTVNIILATPTQFI